MRHVHQVPSEDAFVCGEYAARYISALQSPTGSDGALRTVATAKHFSDYDQEGSHNESDPSSRMNFNAVVSAQDQVQYFWPSFRAAVQEGRVESVMCRYSEHCAV